MADVFVVAILLVFLATDGQLSIVEKELSVFGMNLNIKLASTITSKFETGFYFFLAYCVCSLGIFQAWTLGEKKA
jgi:hypothetical protein